MSFFRPSTKYFVSFGVSFSYFSHIPSQPIIKICYFPVLLTSIISGMHVMGCWLNANPGTFLWLKSPMDLVRLRPLTLPWTMGTPVLAILYFSIGFSGLWSNDSWTHLLFCHNAALESPALAQTILSLVTATTTAVAPAINSLYRGVLCTSKLLYLINSCTPGFNFIMSSTWINVSVRACPKFPSFRAFLLRKTYRKCAATYLETYPPPWPSKTP